jgi:2-aminoethylphosphonate dioxygenase
MLLFKDKINYKGAKGNGFAPHLDAPAYDHIGKIEHVTANFAIDAATRANGCLEVVPGSHKMDDIELVDGGRIGDTWTRAQAWVEVPLAPGDVLIFGSHLAHRSGPNKTGEPRAMLYATFAGRADGENLRQKYYAHRRIEFPPDHGKSDSSLESKEIWPWCRSVDVGGLYKVGTCASSLQRWDAC